MSRKSSKPESDVVVVGASAAGLAAAASLKQRGIHSVTILEQSTNVGANWRKHYDRLHLHTDKGNSNLPYFPFPEEVPKYPSRDQMVRYLELYAQHFDLSPEFGRKVVGFSRDNGLWKVHTDSDRQYSTKNVVVATGCTDTPVVPEWPGMEMYEGDILHSSKYKNGRPYSGKEVLVIGFGNSGGEIAIDLWEHGAQPSVSVRSPVNVIPRDLLGLPILTIAIPLSKLPGWLADLLSAPILNLTIGDLNKYGLEKKPYGPFTQIEKEEKIPLLDIGTLSLIKDGHLSVVPEVRRFTREGVELDDGRHERYDAVILATGYRPNLENFAGDISRVLDEEGKPECSGGETSLPGLYFCGFYVSPTGMLREIGIEAESIAEDISGRLGPDSGPA